MLKDVLKPNEDLEKIINNFRIIVIYKKEKNEYVEKYIVQRKFQLLNFTFWLYYNNNLYFSYRFLKIFATQFNDDSDVKKEIKKISKKLILSKRKKPQSYIKKVTNDYIFKKEVIDVADDYHPRRDHHPRRDYVGLINDFRSRIRQQRNRMGGQL